MFVKFQQETKNTAIKYMTVFFIEMYTFLQMSICCYFLPLFDIASILCSIMKNASMAAIIIFVHHDDNVP